MEPMVKKAPVNSVTIAADGACSGNPGPGGWAVIMQCIINEGRDLHEKVFSGNEDATTNNRMEMTAIIEGLKRIRRKGCDITIITDRQYVADGARYYLKKWKDAGWIKSDKKPVLNQDLWEQIDGLIEGQRVHWHKVKGHSDNLLNNRADAIACFERDKACDRVSN